MKIHHRLCLIGLLSAGLSGGVSSVLADAALPSATGCALAGNAALAQPANASADAFGSPLTRTSEQLRSKRALTIVAIGSSSTAGAGASSTGASYPARLAGELALRLPEVPVQVINRGVNGEEAAEMLERFDRDVLAYQPDLVVWQIGTNAVVRNADLQNFGTLVQEGVDRLRRSGADVVLMDPQFAPRVLSAPEHLQMIQLIQTIGERNHVPVFHRFDMMRKWSEAMKADYANLIAPDGLHMNDASYACLAERLASAILDASNPIRSTAPSRATQQALR